MSGGEKHPGCGAGVCATEETYDMVFVFFLHTRIAKSHCICASPFLPSAMDTCLADRQPPLAGWCMRQAPPERNFLGRYQALSSWSVACESSYMRCPCKNKTGGGGCCFQSRQGSSVRQCRPSLATLRHLHGITVNVDPIPKYLSTYLSTGRYSTEC